ncbi:hypothetical protein DV515_00012665 [Chloebia gouldiae]|uniref:Uncharacterized protein n=1 Tax=Chloebia gouldiae TaxID=44316 RepID=A0A3L8S4B8_CHLGU|nr:hypothetical protein DV515_00012665 [Chloebia gouldiae]
MTARRAREGRLGQRESGPAREQREGAAAPRPGGSASREAPGMLPTAHGFQGCECQETHWTPATLNLSIHWENIPGANEIT